MDTLKLLATVRKQVAAWRATAELLGLDWADAYAAKLEQILNDLFGPATYGATVASHAAGGDPVGAAVAEAQAGGVPAWLIPLLIQFARLLLDSRL